MTKTIFVAATLALWIVSTPLSAQQGSAPPAAALRAAALWFGPLPTPSLFSPTVMKRVEQLAADDHWPMPDEIKPWPLDEHGKPIVTTRQLDELWHHVDRRTTSARRIREMYGGSMARLEALNPGLDLENLEVGDNVLVWQRNTSKVSQSIGSANRGRVSNSEPVPPGDNYTVLYPHRSFGTYYTVSEIVRALDAFGVRFPDSQVIVGDLGFRNGRRIRPHNSHTSGRDVDITYPRVTQPPDLRRFHNVSSRDIDVDRTLWLLKAFIDGGQVEYIFVDRRHQRLLVKEAKKQGASDEWIEAVFQYPKAKGGAIVRHASGHHKHFHVRFKCQETDRSCR